ncbi:hypothetical protein [uncultured Amnibacterium sp.]|uniref:hypothetical protein n=1 Tax=uncultured Amnibacterium sp. TaxID=1631851 RepID=UPI0035CAD77C
MPVLHVLAPAGVVDDATAVRLAAAAAAAAGLAPEQVLVDRIDVRVLDGLGRPADWCSVLIQGSDRGEAVADAVAAAIRESWGDPSLSVAWVLDR